MYFETVASRIKLNVPRCLTKHVPAVLCLTALIATGSASQVRAESPMSMGVNLSYPSRIFTDAVCEARGDWDSPDHFGDAKVPHDADGWPTADGSLMVWEGQTKNNGVYKISFNGKATLSTSFDYGAFSDQAYDAATNTTTATMTVTDDALENFSLVLTETHRTADAPAGSGITNLHVMRPIAPGARESYPRGEMFLRQTKEILAPFSVIRFMDFTATNYNKSVNWSDRPLPCVGIVRMAGMPEMRQSWQGAGAPWEFVIRLANETNKDVWINVPEMATDDYITQLAKLYRDGDTVAGIKYDGLKQDLKIYVEYSNEVWNWSFGQAHQNADAAKAEVKAGHSSLNYDGNTNEGTFAWRRHARRSVEMSKIFRQVFGDAAMMTRVRPVIQWQYANFQETAVNELTYLDGYYNNGDGQNVADPHHRSVTRDI